MNREPQSSKPKSNYVVVLLAALCLQLNWKLGAVGTWVQLNNQPPSTTSYMLLLSDGTVMAQDVRNGARNWYRLTPDVHGSYVNGTWSTLRPMHDGRDAYASQVLKDGRVFVAGGESGGGNGSAEIYDPQLDTWTYCASTGFGVQFYDNISEMLPNGDVLLAPVQPARPGLTLEYNPMSDAWKSGSALYRGYNQDEASWVKLPDDSILTVDPYGTNSERFIPSLNEWINDANVPTALYDLRNYEIGAAVLLQNGKAIFFGATGNTAIYTPSGTTNMGTWQAGATIPEGQGAIDAPAAVMPNGKVLCMFSTAPSYGPPCTFFEYDPISNSFTPTGFPGNSSNYYPNDARMLVLPDGTILFSSNGFGPVYIYQPDGTTLPSGKPTITDITTHAYCSYHLDGLLLNGLNEGAGYGDDAQMNSNYPLVILTNNTTGKVYFARTHDWSSTGVMTGTNVVSTEFAVPATLPAGKYFLAAVADGIASAPFPFTFTPDSLSISGQRGFASIGPIGGPFSPVENAYFLNNIGTNTLVWGLQNTCQWLNVSSVGGTLGAGSQSTVLIGLNDSASNLLAGSYSTTVVASNVTSGALQTIPFNLQVHPILQNGGFETGSFGYWTLEGNAGASHVAASTNANVNDPSFSHSGYFSGFLGLNSDWGYLTQALQTPVGQSFLLSLYIDCPFSTNNTNEFSVLWNGLPLLDEVEYFSTGWQAVQFVVESTSANSELGFAFINQNNYFRLDDVNLTLLPQTFAIAAQPVSQLVPSGGNVVFTVLASGAPPYSYQWEKDGVSMQDGAELRGCRTASLAISNTTVTDSGTYSVVVYSGARSLTSTPAMLQVVGLSTNCQVAAPAGLMGWWTGDLTAHDVFGVNNGVPQNGASYSPGEVGYAFNLNGINQYILVPNSPSLSIQTGSPFSLEAWVYRTQSYLPFHVLGKRIDGGSSNYQLGYDGSSPNVPLNAWTHLVDTYDGVSIYRRYYNGVNVQTSQASPGQFTTNNADLRIGESADYAVFPGLIDDVRIYNRALSAAEIVANYEAGTNGMCAPVPLAFLGAPRITRTNGVILDARLRGSQSYRIQANTNLSSGNWSTLTNFVAGSSPVFHFTNKLSTNSMEQFFRLVSP